MRFINSSQACARLLPLRTRALEPRLLDQAFVLLSDEMALDLRHRIHGHADNNQDGGAAEGELLDIVDAADDFRHQAYERQIEGAHDSNPREHEVDVFRGA